ncbi:conserved hypothetical protein [Clostridiaceae bacterium BL-3]|nr:conserved hypothetical protein [Clostridiaceae bacterium BL-3]
MRIAVISDDLTGASDCGGQLVQYGLNVSVILNWDKLSLKKNDAVIYNTNSRDISEEEAYERVKYVSRYLKGKPFDIVYKKIDSTMRGNIGQEINAMQDVFQKDFVIIVPAYPKNGRQVINGTYYLNHKKLTETEVVRDPKTPVEDSVIYRLIEKQSNKSVGHISHDDLIQGYEHVFKCLVNFKNNNTSYITVDTVNENDLKKITSFIKITEFSVIWCGSAGLMEFLPPTYGIKQRIYKSDGLPKNSNKILFVVGSVSKCSRKQLDRLLCSTDTVGIEVKSAKVILNDKSRKSELGEIMRKVSNSINLNKNVAIFSSAEVKRTQEMGIKQGYSMIQISNMISKFLGEVSACVVNKFKIKNLFVTGGDIAYQVFDNLNVDEFKLLGEMEPGIPFGMLEKKSKIFAVTKAGSFGSEMSMVKAAFILQGNVLKDVNNAVKRKL